MTKNDIHTLAEISARLKNGHSTIDVMDRKFDVFRENTFNDLIDRACEHPEEDKTALINCFMIFHDEKKSHFCRRKQRECLNLDQLCEDCPLKPLQSRMLN